MSLVRGIVVSCALLLAACSTKASVPCNVQADCSAFAGTICADGFCRLPQELDLGNTDLLGIFDDLSGDMSLQPPDMVGFCGTDPSVCMSTQPICDTQYCRACVAADAPTCLGASITTPRCDETTGSCAGCRVGQDAIDCPLAAASVCGADGSCRKACTQHSDCDSGICDMGIMTGVPSCARVDEVVHVKPVATCPSTADGSAANPFCQIDDAVKKLATGGFISIAKGTGGSGLTTVTTPMKMPYVIVAPLNTSIAGDASASSVMTFDDGARAYVYGLTITGGPGAGITCTNSAGLKLSHVTIQDVSGTALAFPSCEAVIDAVSVSRTGGGLALNAGTLSLTNTFITDTKSVGVSIGNNATTDLFAYNTITNNTPGTSTVGGIACGNKKVSVQDSIIRFNKQVSGTSWSGNCAFDHNDIDEALGGTNVNLAPTFYGVNQAIPSLGFNYHLKPGQAANTACCVDKGAAGIVSSDNDGEARPKGAGYDIGADEVQ